MIREGTTTNQTRATMNVNGTVDAGEYILFQTFLRGDINADWRVDLLDVPGFVEVLLGNDTGLAHVRAADMNAGGQADGADVEPFVAAVSGS